MGIVYFCMGSYVNSISFWALLSGSRLHCQFISLAVVYDDGQSQTKEKEEGALPRAKP